MNIFDRQSLKKRQSFLLLLCFIAALISMAVVIHVTIAGFSYLLGQTDSFSDPSTPALALIGIVWMTIIAGGFFRALDVRAGGAVLARKFGAVHASGGYRFEKEQQLMNVVAEMSIASRMELPDVYVLRLEPSINAFVLGKPSAKRGKSKRHVMVLTQGALDAFDRDELLAVVAHEFGHIANDDLTFNMHLLVALGGLMAIDEVGRLLAGEDPSENFHPGVIVGLLLRGLGSVGTLSGRLISAAFSRQREYLADAMAAQYTRDPFSLASALSIIQLNDEPSLHGMYAQELAHLCFQSGAGKPWYKRLLSSHPPLQRRINAIDPHFVVKQRKVKRQCKKVDAVKNSTISEMPLAFTGAEGVSTVVVHEGGSSSALPDNVELLLNDETNCLAVLFALFASTDVIKQQGYLNAIAFGFNDNFSSKVKNLLKSMSIQLHEEKMLIIEHATSVLNKSLELEKRQLILLKLERLLKAGEDYSLMNYASLQLVRQKLDVEFPLIETLATEQVAQARRAKAFDAMGNEFALLLSLMVEASGASKSEQDKEFERVLKCYTQAGLPRRTASEAGIVVEVEAAFQTLYVQPEAIRQAFVQHCVEIIQSDGYVAPSERSLLGLFAASLGCQAMAA